MARPKKNLPPGKDKKFTIRVTDEMFEALESEANAAGLSTSEYARKLLLDHRPIVKQEIVYDSEELLHTLGNMFNDCHDIHLPYLLQHLLFCTKL